MVLSECERHVFWHGPGYRVVRCTHIGERFVMHGEHGSCYVAVDYVEDLPDGGVIVEGTDWYEPEPDAVEATWDDKVSRMRADIPPDPERWRLLP